MKYLLIALFSLSVFSFPFDGEYDRCVDSNETSQFLYVRITEFSTTEIGIQIMTESFPFSMVLKVDGEKHATQENIMGLPFEYISNYQHNEWTIFFFGATVPNNLGLEQKFWLTHDEVSIRFTLNGEEVRCFKHKL